MQQKLNNIILVIFLVLFCNTSLFAANNKIQFSNVEKNIHNVKNNISKWIVDEWHNTVEFQKDSFNQMKIQTENNKKGIIKLFNPFK
tara:strand:- start:127 stop:387 length:261 start_codon:yes stop_codon:yes gene_type:complete